MSTDPTASPEPIRPRDLALLLLASGDLLPRARARDQRADLVGMELKRRVLERLVAVDPEPADLEATLARIVDEFGPPTGPTRAVAILIMDEWRTACAAPEWIAQLIGEASGEAREGRRAR
jgi:hypothetical protein